MAKSLSNGDLIIGIVLTILGALMLLGTLDIPYLALAAAIALIVVGVLMLTGRMNGGTLGGAVALVVGVVMLVSDQFASDIAGILSLVIGILVLLAGILKLLGRW